MPEVGLMDPNLRMEQLSIAYVKAVASFCGYNTAKPEIDDDSVDLTIISSAGKKPKLDIQLKASGGLDCTGTNITFPLKVKNYNDLRAETFAPRILIVLCMPDQQTDWIEHSVNSLLIKKCAYWLSLKNMPETSNTTSVSLSIPITNIVSPEGLHQIMQKIEKGEDL